MTLTHEQRIERNGYIHEAADVTINPDGYADDDSRHERRDRLEAELREVCERYDDQYRPERGEGA